MQRGRLLLSNTSQGETEMRESGISALPFRRLLLKDASAMAGIEQICFTLPWTEKQCAGALTQSSFAAFGLMERGKLIGYISIYHFLPEMEIVNLGVLPAFRRKGAASRMLEKVLHIGHKMGMQKVSLEVRETNFPAIRLYRAMGFIQAGIRKKYYPDTNENALILKREFSGS